MKAGWPDGEGTRKCAFSPHGSLAADTVERGSFSESSFVAQRCSSSRSPAPSRPRLALDP